jgi:hypothetical protein
MHRDWLDDLSDSFGGAEELRRAAGVGRTALANWRRRGFVPSKHWAKLAEYAREKGIRGVTLESLAGLSAKPSQFVNINSQEAGCHPATQHAVPLSPAHAGLVDLAHEAIAVRDLQENAA